MDPMAEKYYSVSPYAYCGNNPVNAVDLRGDSITYIQNNVQYTYNNGAFWTPTGTKYTPEKGSVMSTVLSAYNTIMASGDDVLKGQLNTLVDSKKMHYITEGTKSDVRAWEVDKTHSEQDKMVSEGDPVKTLTHFNFSKEQKDGYRNDEGVEYSEFGIVVHEMQHQYDYDQGKMKDASHKGPGAYRPQEVRAVKNENRARRMQGLPLRTTYGGIKIKF